nr:hypothetical protein [Sphingomonas sp. SCN 67-18]
MRSTALQAILATAFLVGGCGQGADAPANEAAPANASNAAATPAAEVAPAGGPLSAYIGKYPGEKLDGVSFQDHPLVVSAVAAATDDQGLRDRVLGGNPGPSTPVALKDGKLISWSCQQHDCGDQNWSVLIDPAGTAAELCRHDAEKSGEASLWYRAGAAPETRAGGCPSE